MNYFLKNDKVKTLEASLDMKSEGIQTMNEEVMSKCKIIKDHRVKQNPSSNQMEEKSKAPQMKA